MKNETRNVLIVILGALIIILLLFNVFFHRYIKSFAETKEQSNDTTYVFVDLGSLIDKDSMNISVKRDSIISIITDFNQKIRSIDSLISVEKNIQHRIEQNTDVFLDKVNIWVTFWVSFIAFFLTIIPILLNIRTEKNISHELVKQEKELEKYKNDCEETINKVNNSLADIQKDKDEIKEKVKEKIEEINIKGESLNLLYCYNMIDTIGTKLDYYNSDDRRSYMELMLKEAIKSAIVLQHSWKDQMSKGKNLIEERLIVKRTLILAISKVLIFMEGNKIKKPKILYAQMEKLKAIRYDNLDEIETENERFSKILDEMKIYYRIEN